MRLRDKAHNRTHALPNGANTTNGSPIDLGPPPHAVTELIVEAPALSTAQLPDGQTVTYRIQHSADAAFSVPVLLADLLVQLGAGGAGAAAAERRIPLPSNVKQFVRLVTVKAGAADASAAQATLGMLF